MPLMVRVQYARVLAGAGVSVAVLMILVGVFASGVPVGSRDTVASVTVLNKYNFFTGTVAGMLAKPFEMAIALFVPVLSLVLSPRNSLQNESVAWRALLFCAQGTLGALLTGAFSTLNVQQLDPVVVPTIIASDLSSPSSLDTALSSGSDSIGDDLLFSLRATADTLLRTAILPVYVKATESVCQGRGGWPNIATIYAFFANDWLIDLLPDGHEASFSLHSSVGALSSASTTDSNFELDSSASSESAIAADRFNASLSANLLLYMMFFSQTLLAWDGLSYLENSSLAQFQDVVTSWRAAEDTNGESITDFELAASTMLNKTLSEQSTRLGLNFDTAAASFNASRIRLSADIDFDVVTLEIPFDEHAITSTNTSVSASASNSAPNSSDTLIRSFSSITECGGSACLVPPPGDSFSATATLGDAGYSQWNVEPQIQAFSACIFEDGTEYMTADYLHGASCTRRSSTSFLIYSFARRVVADAMVLENASSANASPMASVTNLQRYHTITLGRLSWRTKDLANKFNAACEVSDKNSACMGLTIPLAADNSSTSSVRHLIVGESYLPVGSLGKFDGLYSRWTPLAMVTTPNDMQGDLLFHRNVRHFEHKDWQNLDGQCSSSVDVFATQVDQNRWYMSFGLQETYTAAIFLLFQNAVVREEIMNTDGAHTLNFAGSSTVVTLEARIPLASVLISVFGSVIILVGALCIAIAGRRQEGTIQRDLGVEEIAKVLLVEHRFPRIILDCTVDDPDG
ncbi:hypothetical protein BBP00_00002036 [Phytophthora kernoviae]|uniref:Uncharacterized protein n=1 Tax=Phytophthora kernoviae TaxID=325452 RepID=A0A3F2RYJ3_9STRA|nr:hypothetical protein BBP00_00002036 [Phytophthora kernoviae]